MSIKLFRGFAIALGAGMALGVTSTLKSRSLKRPLRRFEREDVLHLEPLLDRLDLIEGRAGQVPEALESKLEMQAADTADLRLRIQECELRLDRTFATIQSETPGSIEHQITSRMGELHLRLMEDLEREQDATLQRFESALDEKVALKVSHRIADFERKLTEQSSLLASVTERAAKTDLNLQRLIGAVQKLVDRSTLEPKAEETNAVESDAAFLDLPFQAHLEQAIASSQGFPKNGEKAAENGRDLPNKRRVPLTPLMGIALMLGLRWFR